MKYESLEGEEVALSQTLNYRETDIHAYYVHLSLMSKLHWDQTILMKQQKKVKMIVIFYRMCINDREPFKLSQTCS